MQQCCKHVALKRPSKVIDSNSELGISVYDVLKFILLKQVIEKIEGKNIVLL
jgi:hypothetical protein